MAEALSTFSLPPRDPREFLQNEFDKIPLNYHTVNGPAKIQGPMVIGPVLVKTETDPHGLNAHAPGAKLDAGKPRPGLVLGGFARALLAVTRIGTGGAAKYTDNGWMEVPNGVERYDDAKLRHWLYEKSGIECDPDTAEMHAAHEAWNALARLDLLIRKAEAKA